MSTEDNIQAFYMLLMAALIFAVIGGPLMVFAFLGKISAGWGFLAVIPLLCSFCCLAHAGDHI